MDLKNIVLLLHIWSCDCSVWTFPPCEQLSKNVLDKNKDSVTLNSSETPSIDENVIVKNCLEKKL